MAKMYSGGYIVANAARFLDYEWIDIRALKDFLGRTMSDPVSILFSSHPFHPSASSDSIHVKIEPPHPSVTPFISIKSEPDSTSVSGISGVRLQTLNEGGQEIFELISDSEAKNSDPDSDVEVTAALMRPSSQSSSIIPPSDVMDMDDQNINDDADLNTGDDKGCDDDDQILNDDDNADNYTESDTVWDDPIKSFMCTGQFSITRKVKVQQIEYLSELPSIWPIPRVPTAFVIDLSDEKHNIIDEAGDLIPIDCIIWNADNDGWKSVPGSGDTTAKVMFAPGEARMECRLNRSLLDNIVRYELDPATQDTVLAAQAEMRQNEGTAAEQHAIYESCSERKGTSRGHQYFIGCSGYSPKFKLKNSKHHSFSIPEHVDEDLLARLLTGQPLANGDEKDTPPCSRFVKQSMGLKQRYCPHAHIKNGAQAYVGK
ncbi:hypothetical protein B0H10DRAFT_1967130 [Mycena sp. CBHHK59/15]|nr:hypothetical protein B0H10DRAFT_1967130 [Mycena sp. CBHHK59/15]